MKRTKRLSKRNWAIFSLVVIVLAVVLISLHLTGHLKFGASTTLPTITNDVYGTYSSQSGNGSIPNNVSQVQVNAQ